MGAPLGPKYILCPYMDPWGIVVGGKCVEILVAGAPGNVRTRSEDQAPYVAYVRGISLCRVFPKQGGPPCRPPQIPKSLLQGPRKR